uniref:Uncharacterized protein n=1 Tax=viral metagenome TaxID=1070528 RepID=A0A6M3LXD9_9ZZZZ
MFPPEYLPLESHGMSVFTALTFFFIGVGSVFMYNLFRRELKRINNKIEAHSKATTEKIKDTNEKVDLLFTKIDNSNSDIAKIMADIATTAEAVKWIKQFLWTGKK